MIAPATDIDRIMAVMSTAFNPAYGEAWTRRQVEDALIAGNCHYLLIGPEISETAADAPVAGFCLSRHGVGEEELLLFAIDPAYRRRDLGRTLLARFAEAAQARGAQRLLLEMRKGNPAEHLYRTSGFFPVGERRAYYHTTDGQCLDAITFVRNCGELIF